MPGHVLRARNQVEWRDRQCRHMQRLANVASGIGVAGVMVERRTRDEVQQRQATQYRQRAPLAFMPENSPGRVHRLIVSVYQLRRMKTQVGCPKRLNL